jgi:hypothetical protein
VKNRKWVVRVSLPRGPKCIPRDALSCATAELVECFRYAGLVSIVDLHNVECLCFDIHCPEGWRDDVWADVNANRMRHFGFDAVKAREWPPSKSSDAFPRGDPL